MFSGYLARERGWEGLEEKVLLGVLSGEEVLP